MGEGPRWVGDNKPDLPADLQRAQNLPPLVTDKYSYVFFGYESPHPEICLQQWYPSPFDDPDSADEHDDEALSFHTSEQYMMYWKALLMGDDATAEKIFKTTEPGDAKALGRKVSNFDQEVWDANGDMVVERGKSVEVRAE